MLEPVHIFLSGARASTLLLVRNTGAEPLRLQLRAFAWDQTSDGSMQLDPTSDVLVFPTLLSLPPGDQRSIRVAVTVPPGQVERTYRLVLEELLPPGSQRQIPGGSGARVVTKTSIPVFLAPVKPIVDARIESPRLTNSVLTFEVRNIGKIHLLPPSIRISGARSGGATAFEHEIPGWYILAAGTRRYTVPIPPDVCRTLDRVQIQIRAGEAVYSERLTLLPASCSG